MRGMAAGRGLLFLGKIAGGATIHGDGWGDGDRWGGGGWGKMARL